MSVGDVWELSLIGEFEGQPVHNIFHYQTTVEPSGEIQAPDIPNFWVGGALQTEWLLSFGAAYVLQAYRSQRIYNGDTSALSSLPPFQLVVNEPGTGGSSPVPSLSTVITSYNTLLGPDEIFFKGKKFMAAGTELTTEDGQIDAVLTATIQAFFDDLVLPSDVGSGNIIQFGVWSRTRAEFLDPTVILPVDDVSIRLNLGSLLRRKRGTSSGGFQP